MSIENRDLAFQQQRDTYQANLAAIATGGTAVLCILPYPGQVDAAGIVAPNGISGTPSLNLEVLRYVVGGATTLGSLASTLSLAGSTLAQGFTVFTGASQLLLQTGDVLCVRVGGTNSSVFPSTLLSVSVRALQDIKTCFGV